MLLDLPMKIKYFGIEYWVVNATNASLMVSKPIIDIKYS